MVWFRALEALVTAVCCAVASMQYLHMLQLESYQLPGYRRWLSTHSAMQRGTPLYAGLIATALSYALSFLLTMVFRGRTPDLIARGVAMALLVVFAWRVDAHRRATKQKKAFVFTARMRRLFAACAAISLVVAALVAATGFPPYVLMALVPWLPVLAATAMQPWEKRVNDGFFRDAQNTLSSRPDLIRIGVTGSYGKTSTKFVLATILAEKYCVLASPASFNTPMGLTRVIREQLEPRHQVFLAEMGARHKGDIEELVRLVQPQYGLLTSVGAQHLETFGNIETVARTKYELIEGLPTDGAAFFVSDGGVVDSLYDKARCEKYLVANPDAKPAYFAKNVVSGPSGSRFTLVLEGRELPVTTRLLGMHNIRNIVLACACAQKLGLNDTQIMRGVSKIRPVEHRLALLPSTGGITVIDDAFNANPVGAAEALRILSTFPGRHIVVTPGFVEEGELETAMNRELGEQIAANCDIAILVGLKHTAPIAQGARKAGMADERVHSVASLAEAQRVLARVARSGDSVLFENDLPDNYTET